MTELAQRVKVGDPLDPETQMGSLISRRHREKVHGFVEGARGEGAEVTTGGETGRARRVLSADRDRGDRRLESRSRRRRCSAPSWP